MSTSERKEWTPIRGLIKALVWGLIATAILSGILAPVARHAPVFLINIWVRGAIGFAVAWILFSVIHAAAGMTSSICTALAVVLSIVVMFSNHLVWAYTSIPTMQGHAGPQGFAFWFHPAALFTMNITAFIGIGGCAMISSDGVPGPDIIGHLLTQPMYGRTR